MQPKYVIYECENCGKLFFREVQSVLMDDADDCHVKVKLIATAESTELEEFPMCECIGGDANFTCDDDINTKAQ